MGSVDIDEAAESKPGSKPESSFIEGVETLLETTWADGLCMFKLASLSDTAWLSSVALGGKGDDANSDESISLSTSLFFPCEF